MKIKLLIWILLLFGLAIIFYFSDSLLPYFDFIDIKYIKSIWIVLIFILVTYILSKIIDIFFYKFTDRFIKTNSLAKKFFPLIHNIAIIFVWIISWILLFQTLWFNLNTFLTWAWIWWVILALAWKEAASNLFWSLSLIFSKSFKPWDIIRIKWLEWTVKEITLSYTKLTDKNWYKIYIPNKNIITESVENLSQWKSRKIEITIPLSINNNAKQLSEVFDEIEKYAQKKSKKNIINDYKIFFDSASLNSQIVIFSFLVNTWDDLIKLKKDTYLDIRWLLDDIWITF